MLIVAMRRPLVFVAMAAITISCQAGGRPAGTWVLPSFTPSPPTQTLSPGMATLLARWATEESQATPTTRGPRPTLTPSVTPQPSLSNLEGSFLHHDGIDDKIAFIHSTFGTPDAVLYRNGSRGPLADYGDFTNDVSFSLLLQYAAPGLVFYVASNYGPFVASAPDRGTLQICTSAFFRYGYWAEVQILQGSRVPQQELLYRDLSTATGLSPDAIIQVLETPDRCLPVPVRLPASSISQTPGLLISDFTRQSPGCRLPCWNGLTPGESTDTDIQAFFERLGVSRADIRADPDRNEYKAYIGNYPVEFPSEPPSVTVRASEGIVRAIRVLAYDYYDFMTFAHLRSNLGTPEDLGLTDWGGQGRLDYDLIFHYRSLRTAVEVSGHTLRSQPELCNSPESEFLVSAIMYEDPSDSYAMDFYETYHGLPDLPAVLGQTASSILTALSVPGSCIALPAALFES